MKMKNQLYNQGIILASGRATRLLPISRSLSKSMLPISADKFVIDYPLNTMRQMGVKELTIIIGCDHYDQIVGYLRSGTDLGFKIHYVFQDEPNGISAAINQCEPYMTYNTVVLLGDNAYQKPLGWNEFDAAKHNPYAARIALAAHQELHRFGVASVKNGKIVRIVEKPKLLDLDPDLQHFAITGAYGLTHQFFRFFEQTKPSARGEFEITDILNAYLKEDLLEFSIIDGWWQDCGSHSAIDKVRELVEV